MRNWNKGPVNKTAAASENQEDIRWVRQEGFRTGVGEVSSRDVQHVTESEGLDIVEGSAPSGTGNQKLDIVQGSTPSETDEEPTHIFSIIRAGNVGAPITLSSSASTGGKRKKNF
jgi:hypothetical protein